MSIPTKTISFQQFSNALETVAAYCKQLEPPVAEVLVPKGSKINLEGQITNSMFRALVRYYKREYNIDLRTKDLQYMHINLLAAINYEKLINFRGMGTKRIIKFKSILQSHSVIK